jgi:predicted heme/steroid binding protein
MSRRLRQISPEELRHCDGSGVAPTHVAYQGIVYGVSGSFVWREGKHQALHVAGFDLTADMTEAPHGASALEPFPVVGVLDEARKPVL